MGWTRRVFRSLFPRQAVEESMDEELRYHLAREVERNVAEGMSEEEARQAARREFGSMALTLEQCREERGVRWLGETVADVRYALRLMGKEPGFVAAGVLSIALGIGAITAVFSIVNGVLLQPLAYPAPERIVSLHESIRLADQRYPALPVSANHFTEWRKASRSFDGISVLMPGTVTLTGSGEPERLDSIRVSANLFRMLGVAPRLGRGFRDEEGTAGHEGVAVISDRLWRRRFSGDAGIIGRSVLLDDTSYAVVGVLPAEFRSPGKDMLGIVGSGIVEPDVYLPKVFGKEELGELMGQFNYRGIGRLKDGATVASATADLNVIAARLMAEARRKSGDEVTLTALVEPLLDASVKDSKRGLLMLLGAVSLVLLIICVNLANLALARGERRAHEFSLRTALGAGKARLLRQAFTESALITAAGGVLGVVCAGAALGVLVRMGPQDIPRLQEAHLDATVLLFALAATTVTGLLFGVAPAWRMSRAQPQSVLQSHGRGQAGGTGSVRLRSGLVAAEVALGSVLLITASLLMMSFLRVTNAEAGFQAPTVLAADIAIPQARFATKEQRTAFFERVVERLESSPGVAAAGVSSALPFQGETWVDMAYLPGDNRPLFERPSVNLRFITPDYLRTMGIPLMAGRAFSEADRGRDVALVSQSLAQTLWPDQNALGRVFLENNRKWEVIGVVGDVRTSVEKAAPMMAYRGVWDFGFSRMMLAVRAKGEPWSVAASIREAVRSVEPDVPVAEMHTMNELLAGSVAQRRFQVLLVAIFAAVALVLAAIGIYGVVSYTVARRVNEIGIRMALGAQESSVYRLILRQGLTPVAIGLVVGMGGAIGTGRLIESLLYEVDAQSPAVMAAVGVSLVLVAIAACYVPARRGACVAPVAALRCD